MKNTILFFSLFFGVLFTINAQSISDHAIGVRLGSNNGFGGEISYQHKLSDVNRLEVDLGWRSKKSYSAFKATGLYQWVWQLENKFNWYVGVGGGLGNWNVKATNDSDVFFFGAGNVGIEYNFDIPLLISLDYRPEIGFGNIYDGLNSDIALSLRYQF